MAGGGIVDRDTLVSLLVDRVRLGVIPLDKVPETFRAEVEEKLHE